MPARAFGLITKAKSCLKFSNRRGFRLKNKAFSCHIREICASSKIRSTQLVHLSWLQANGVGGLWQDSRSP